MDDDQSLTSLVTQTIKLFPKRTGRSVTQIQVSQSVLEKLSSEMLESTGLKGYALNLLKIVGVELEVSEKVDLAFLTERD